MKINKIVYTAIALLSLSLSSCSDWLDYEPKDQTTENTQFSSRSGFYSAVNGAYNSIISSTLYGRNLTYGAVDCMGKRYYTGTSTTRMDYLWSNYSFTDTNVASAISSIWSTAYNDILDINVILSNLETHKNVLTTQDYNVIKGDMLALRAFLHLDMLRLFGPVYSKDSESAAIPYNDSNVAQTFELLSSKSIIYDHIIPDLNEAETALKTYDPIITDGTLETDAETGDNYLRYRQLRLNYYAVALLKARAYLWAGDNENALTEARKITDDTKVATTFPFVNADKLLGNNTDPDRVFSTEVLFGFYNSERDNIYTNNFDGDNLNASALLQPRASYIESLFPNKADYRYLSQWKTSGNLFNFVKYREISVNTDDAPFYTYLQPLMRLSEAYYIAAEALSSTNPTAAVNYLNTILTHRGVEALAQTSTATEIMNEVKQEYIRDMYGEGQSFYMFKRLYMAINSTYNAESSSSVSASNARFVLPLPSNELTNRKDN